MCCTVPYGRQGVCGWNQFQSHCNHNKARNGTAKKTLESITYLVSITLDNKMHTVWVRLNAVVFFGLSVLLTLSVLAAVSKFGHSWYHQPGTYVCITYKFLPSF